MNLQPVPIEEIPIGKPLPWRLYDHSGYIVFARGEMVNSREQLESLLADGLLRDSNAPPQTNETGDWNEFKEIAPNGTFPPMGIKPQVGELVQLRLLNRNLQSYYSVRLIGYIKNQSILVMTPTVDKIPLILMDGEQIEVRMLTGSNIFAFQTSIQRLCITPVHYMHLDYPLEVRAQKLRKSPWAKVNLGTTVSNENGISEVARIVNLSSEGAQLQAPSTLGKKGNNVQLAFHASMDELRATLTIDATILHVNKPRNDLDEEANMLEYGIAFHDVSETDAIWLKTLVYRHIAEGHMA
jgi:hypothetical protein